MQKITLNDQRKFATLFAKRFISRTDVFAQQLPDGSYRPVRRKINLHDLLDHLNGEKTYGHYLLDAEANTKIFCIDIDFNTRGWIPGVPMPKDETDLSAWENWDGSFSDRDIRSADGKQGAWFLRSDPAREFLKGSLRKIVDTLLSVTSKTLGVPAVAAYSGHKGAHVYGFLAYDQPGAREVKRVTGSHAKSAGELVINTSKMFKQKSPGSVFWEGKPEYEAARLFTCEVYPKQSVLQDQELGNLLRLPLGKNLKRPGDPTFWIDDTAPESILAPLDTQKMLEKYL